LVYTVWHEVTVQYGTVFNPISSSRLQLTSGDYLQDKMEDVRAVLCCVVYHCCAQ